MAVAAAIAAGEAIISASGVVEVVKNYVVSFATEEFKGLRDLEQNVPKLKNTLVSIEADLKVAEERQDESEDIRKWLQKLKNVAYDLEDVLDDYALEGPAEEEEHMGALTQWTRLAINSLWLLCDVPLSCFGIATPVTPLRNILHRLQSIKKELEEVNKKKESLGGGASSSETTTSLPDKGLQMVGRRETKKQIKATLVKSVSARVEGSSLKITVVGIAGLGGMGKTTLAQDIFSDQEWVEKFSFRKWVDVGENFDAESVIDKIIREKKDDVLPKDLCDLQTKLIDKIKDKRFLIVLDNAWCTVDNEWVKLWNPLTHGEEGGALVVTARDLTVARAIPRGLAYSEHKLGEMPEEECLEILKKSALKGQKTQGREWQCKQIVKKLKGVPLAADLMGRFLGKHLDNDDIWRNVVTDEGWSQTDEEELVHRVTGLSYRHLPSYLKPCFAYCSIFPKGFRFYKDTIVQMWIAQGYIQPRDNQLMEHIGSIYFNELCQMSFFQLKPSGYVMHDLVNDFAQKIFPEGRGRIVAGDGEAPPEQVRHVSLHLDGSDSTVLQNLRNYKKLRTLMIYAPDITAPALDVLREFKYMRVLVLNCYKISVFPESIGHLKLLRYLDISQTDVWALPELVCNLLNLQVLKLRFYSKLPEVTSTLVNLRCLEGAVNDLATLPQLGRLTSLQVLKFCNVSKDRGCRIQELSRLNDLHGSLEIFGLGNVQGKEEALLANLKDKVYLEGLTLRWETGREDNAGGIRFSDSQVLEGLCPPPNLKRLVIRDNLGDQPPSWMKEQHQLSDVSLDSCSNWKCLPSLGQLPHLNHLSVSDMNQWEGWGYMPVGPVFPSLQVLDLDNCPKLTSLSPMLRHMTTLTELKICRCAQLSSLEDDDGELVFAVLHTLEIKSCPKLTSLSPMLHDLSALEILLLKDCHQLSSLVVPPLLKSLNSLMIESCPMLKELATLPSSSQKPSSSFPRLQRFSTDNRCSLMWVLPQKLEALEFLEITDLHNDLIYFTEAEEEGWKHLTSLRDLTFRNCPGLRSLPDGGLPASLRELTIGRCPQLRSLPSSMHILSSLHNLALMRCPEINRLPDGGLPGSLRVLIIHDCPKLVESCREGGPDRHKIPRNANIYLE